MDPKAAPPLRLKPRRVPPEWADVIVPVEDGIAEIRAGRMIILTDDEDRENEGDLCMAAECVTPEAINFMARFGRGLICLSLTEERLQDLRLPMMVPDGDNTTTFGTAFTISIEARQGVTTGISAADRAHTIRVAIDDESRPHDLVASRPHLPAARARRRRAAPRRPDRRLRRPRPARRAETGRRDLRGDERRRLDGAHAESRRVRAHPRPQDRHDRAVDRVPAPQREAGAAHRRGGASHRRSGRVALLHLRERHRPRRPHGAGEGRDQRRRRRAGARAQRVPHRRRLRLDCAAIAASSSRPP